MQPDEAPRKDSVSVKWEELREAFDYVNSALVGENTARFSIVSGQIDCGSVWTEIWGDTDDGGGKQAEPKDQTLEIPHKTQLGLGRDLALWFVEEVIPDLYDDVADFFQKRGAYGKFKALLAEEGLLQDWYQFESTAEEQALRNWCEENGISILDADPPEGPAGA